MSSIPEYQPPPVPPQPPQVPWPPRASEPVPPKRKTSGCLIALGVTIGLAVLVIILIALVMAISGSGQGRQLRTPSGRVMVEHTISGAGKDKVLVVPITGMIADVDGGMLQAVASVSEVRDMLHVASKDPSIRALILDIDSPGGAVTACDVLHHELLAFAKQHNVKVVAMGEDVVASGGYYLACSGDKIIIHPTTITGSIGVILPIYNMEKLFEKIGVAPQPIKSGEFKDIGAMSRAMTPEEHAMLERLVMQMSDRFKEVVRGGFVRRNATTEQTEEAAKYCDGRVFTPDEAVRLGFVDQIGYFDDAVTLACGLAGTNPATTRVVTYRRQAGLLGLLSSETELKSPGVTINIQGASPLQSPKFMYLWTLGMPATKSAPFVEMP